MTTIGYATLQIIPSLRGVSEAINKQLGGTLRVGGKQAGKDLAMGVGEGIKANQAIVKTAMGNYANLYGTVQVAAKKAADEEKKYHDLVAKKADYGSLVLQSNRIKAARTDEATAITKARDAYREYEVAKKHADSAGSGGLEHFSSTVHGLTGALGNATPALTRFASGALLGVAGAATTAAAALVGVTLFKGFQRLESIDTAKFKLKALGHNAAEVTAIMDSANKSVKGTSFGLEQAATSAASAVAAGIKPGEQLTKYLKDVADTAAVAGTSMSDMGDLFNQIQSQGHVFAQDLNQLSANGVPIFQWLQEEYGVTAGALTKMVSKGEVDAAHFQAAIEKHIGGAALTMGQSFSGSVQNAEAALARLGAAILKPIFENAGVGITSLTEGLDKLTAWIDQHQPAIIDFWTKIGTAAIRGLQNVARGAGGMLQAIGDIAGGIGNIQGTVLKFESWQATVRGDTETAAELHRQSEEAYGWGESIRTLGDKLANLNLDSWAGKVRAWGGAAKEAAANTQGMYGAVTGLGTALGALPLKKVVTVDADTGPAEVKMQSWFDKWKSIIAAPPTPTPAPPVIPSLTDPNRPNFGRAAGGSIFGPGTGTSDSVPIMASHGEHMWTASEVDAVGGQGNMYRLRALARKGAFKGFAGGGAMDFWKLGALIWPPEPVNKTDKSRPGGVPDLRPGKSHSQIGLPEWGTPGTTFGPPPPGWWDKPIDPNDVLFPEWMPPGQRDEWLRKWGDQGKRWKKLGFKDGGAIGPDVSAAGALVGTPYSKANRTDCSGMPARVIDRTLGLPESGLMTTKTATEWLAARGFKPGIGGPGTISVGWYDHGPNPNDGHMAMTLSDGSNAESGGGVGDIFQIGGGAAGASDPQFDQHMFLPTVYGEGAAGSGSASPFAGGSAAAAVTGAAPAAPSSGGGGSSSSGGGGGSSFSLPSSIGGLAAFGLSDLGKGVGTTKSGSDLSLFGNAAATAVSGQVDSALGVLGVSGSPGWLKAISTLVGGISIGGKGDSAAPLSATSTGMGTPPPDDPGNMHGSRAGQQPGPVYNITARDTEDAFVRAQRIEREKSAAKLSRF